MNSMFEGVEFTDADNIIDEIFTGIIETDKKLREEEACEIEEYWKDIVEEFFEIKGEETPELKQKGLKFARAYSRMQNMYDYIRQETACFKNNIAPEFDVDDSLIEVSCESEDLSDFLDYVIAEMRIINQRRRKLSEDNMKFSMYIFLVDYIVNGFSTKLLPFCFFRVFFVKPGLSTEVYGRYKKQGLPETTAENRQTKQTVVFSSLDSLRKSEIKSEGRSFFGFYNYHLFGDIPFFTNSEADYNTNGVPSSSDNDPERKLTREEKLQIDREERAINRYDALFCQICGFFEENIIEVYLQNPTSIIKHYSIRLKPKPKEMAENVFQASYWLYGRYVECTNNVVFAEHNNYFQNLCDCFDELYQDKTLSLRESIRQTELLHYMENTVPVLDSVNTSKDE